MALKTGGTKATTTLSGAQWPGPNGADSISDADIASIATSIINDENPPMIWPGAFSRMGLLYVPNRGILKVRKDDWVFYDPSGFPYLIPGVALPKTLTRTGTTNSTTTLTVTTSAITAGWRIGMTLSAGSADIPAGTTITAISSDGLTLTLSAAATGSNAGQTITAGSWTHN